ncbi:MAG: signal peptidase I [Chitinophagaceae bacterium]|nr:signal peptidase I [Chitinophagaceae bacterium]
MKKKLIVAAAIVCSILVAGLVAGRILGFWQFFSIPAPSNEPTIKAGSHIIISNLKKPVHYSFVVFSSRVTDSMSFPGAEIIQHSQYFFRLCGLPGDVLQMKNGTLFVNNKNFDIDLNLNQEYKIANTDADKIDREDVYANKYVAQLSYTTGDSVIVTFDNTLKNKYREKVNLVPFVMDDTSSRSGVFKWFAKTSTWGVDNFGPLTIPASHCFVMGDNRHNALDSRYTGFIPLKDITGVVIYKY